MPKLKKIIALLLMLALPGPIPVICAHEVEDNLVRISLSIFPKLVAVDLEMKDKLTSDDKVRFHVFYDRKKELADAVADHLRKDYPRVGKYATQVTLGNSLPVDAPTAILIIERLEEAALKPLIEYGIENHILVFSPFKEDVDRGVTAGMYVAIRVLPYFNRDTLDRSRIKIHRILLRSAKFYE